jgi:hypothetical protein
MDPGAMNGSINSAVSAAELIGSPLLYPQHLNPESDAVFLLRLDESQYRAASFLDARLPQSATPVGWAPLAPIEPVLRHIRAQPLHFIFHAGHVGSTLLSRLLDEVPGVLGLREPLPLRTLADLHDRTGGSASFQRLLAIFLALWSRGFAGTSSVILKATSNVTGLAPDLMARSPGSRAVALNLAAEPYICTLLAGEQNRDDLEGFTQQRLDRLERMLGVRADAQGALSLGEGAALAWLMGRLAQSHAAAVLGSRLLPLDFEAFLADIPATLARVLAHFALPPEYAGRIAQSPALSRYSKMPADAYSPQLRQALLEQTRQEQSREIRRGLDFLARLGAEHAALAALL